MIKSTPTILQCLSKSNKTRENRQKSRKRSASKVIRILCSVWFCGDMVLSEFEDSPSALYIKTLWQNMFRTRKNAEQNEKKNIISIFLLKQYCFKKIKKNKSRNHKKWIYGCIRSRKSYIFTKVLLSGITVHPQTHVFVFLKKRKTRMKIVKKCVKKIPTNHVLFFLKFFAIFWWNHGK